LQGEKHPKVLLFFVTTFFTLTRSAEFIEALVSPTPFFRFYGERFSKDIFFFLSSTTLIKFQIITDFLSFSSYFMSRVVRTFGELLVFVGISSYFLICDKFCRELKETLNIREFQEKWTCLLKNIRNLNRVIGLVLMGITIHIVPMYMIWSTEMFFSGRRDEASIREKLSFLSVFLFYSIFFWLAAFSLNKVIIYFYNCTKKY
jgi:hypothetical protein